MKKYLNGKMTYEYMVDHLANNRGGLLINGEIVTDPKKLPRPEDWHAHDQEEKLRMAETVDRDIKLLEEKRRRLLAEAVEPAPPAAAHAPAGNVTVHAAELPKKKG